MLSCGCDRPAYALFMVALMVYVHHTLDFKESILILLHYCCLSGASSLSTWRTLQLLQPCLALYCCIALHKALLDGTAVLPHTRSRQPD